MLNDVMNDMKRKWQAFKTYVSCIKLFMKVLFRSMRDQELRATLQDIVMSKRSTAKEKCGLLRLLLKMNDKSE